MRNPFRYFNSSPEIIRLTVMMYVRNFNSSRGHCQANGFYVPFVKDGFVPPHQRFREVR